MHEGAHKMNVKPETVDAGEVYLFGYPVQVSLKFTDTEIVDVTHALQWDRKTGMVTLDPSTVLDAVDAALTRGYGLSK